MKFSSIAAIAATASGATAWVIPRDTNTTELQFLIKAIPSSENSSQVLPDINVGNYLKFSSVPASGAGSDSKFPFIGAVNLSTSSLNACLYWRFTPSGALLSNFNETDYRFALDHGPDSAVFDQGGNATILKPLGQEVTLHDRPPRPSKAPRFRFNFEGKLVPDPMTASGGVGKQPEQWSGWKLVYGSVDTEAQLFYAGSPDHVLASNEVTVDLFATNLDGSALDFKNMPLPGPQGPTPKPGDEELPHPNGISNAVYHTNVVSGVPVSASPTMTTTLEAGMTTTFMPLAAVTAA